MSSTAPLEQRVSCITKTQLGFAETCSLALEKGLVDFIRKVKMSDEKDTVVLEDSGRGFVELRPVGFAKALNISQVSDFDDEPTIPFGLLQSDLIDEVDDSDIIGEEDIKTPPKEGLMEGHGCDCGSCPWCEENAGCAG